METQKDTFVVFFQANCCCGGRHMYKGTNFVTRCDRIASIGDQQSCASAAYSKWKLCAFLRRMSEQAHTKVKI